MDLLVSGVPSRVVTVSSIAHYKGTIDFDDLSMEKSYGGHMSYRRSKLANVLFSSELARRTKGWINIFISDKNH